MTERALAGRAHRVHNLDVASLNNYPYPVHLCPNHPLHVVSDSKHGEHEDARSAILVFVASGNDSMYAAENAVSLPDQHKQPSRALPHARKIISAPASDGNRAQESLTSSKPAVLRRFQDHTARS
jgi:hypothetical protein